MSTLTLPPITSHEGLQVVRGDMIEGGFKRLAIDGIFKNIPKENVVFATNSYGFGAVALTLSLQHTNKRIIIFLSKWDSISPNLLWCQKLGATLDFSGNSNLRDSAALQAEARNLYDSDAYEILPLGLETPEVRCRIFEIAKLLFPHPPKELWIATASGLLVRTFQNVFPSTKFHAVLVKGSKSDIGRAEPHIPEERFEEPAKILPPYQSAAHYDAKVWRIAREKGIKDATILNVA